MLAAGSMHLRVARRVLREDPDRADAILSTLAENQQAVLVDVEADEDLEPLPAGGGA